MHWEKVYCLLLAVFRCLLKSTTDKDAVKKAKIVKACLKPIGGGFHHCAKCNLWFCDLCVFELIKTDRDPYKCPVCNVKFGQ
jgi:hypothetical protein